MKRLIAFLFYIVASFTALLPGLSLADVTIGSFNYGNEKAIVMFSSFFTTGKYTKKQELLLIDFKNQKTHVIDKGSDLGWNKVNRSGTRVAYLKGPSLLKIYDLNEEEIIYEKNNGVDGIHFYWTENPHVLAGINKKNNLWFSLNLQEDSYQESKYTDQYLWGVAWLASCACVEFEVSDTPYTDHYVISLIKGEIKKIEGKQHLSYSPDGRYTLYGKESLQGEGLNELILIDNSHNTARNYYSADPIGHERVLWGNDVVRILTDTSLLDLRSARSISPEYYVWVNKRERKRHITVFDIAADPAGYVLRWDMIKKQFLVEDINVGGKIIKTYEKFW